VRVCVCVFMSVGDCAYVCSLCMCVYACLCIGMSKTPTLF